MADEGLSNVLQENLLTLLCFDDKHSAIIRNLIEANLFEGLYREIATAVYVYIDTQKEAPKGHLPDLFDTIIEGNDRKAKQYRTILIDLEATKSDINSEFVMNRLSDFVRHQQLKRAMTEAIDIFQSGKVSEDQLNQIEGVLANAMKKRLEVFEPGIFLGDTAKGLSFMDSEESEVFRTGIPDLDRRRLGPMRQGLHLFIGLPKRGKTWWLVNLGKNAYLEGKKVCHISLEMSAQKMARRYYQALFAIARNKPDDDNKLRVTEFNLDDLGRLVGFDRKYIKPKLFLSDDGARRELERRIDKFGLRLDRILIKSFPTKQLTTSDLNAYLDALELQQNFIPDLLLLDYPQLMKFDYHYQRLALGDIVATIRGFGVERNMAVAIVSQSSKKGLDALQVHEGHAAEDWSQIGTADAVLTYSQSQSERRLNLARISVVAAREEEDKFTILISQSYATGQFCRDSTRIRSNYLDILGSELAEDSEEAEEED